MPETWAPLLVVVVGFAILLYGFSKTAMPVAGVVAGPMLAAALGPTVAAGFAVPLLILGDLMGLVYFRQHANWRLIAKIVPGVLVGFAITACALRLRFDKCYRTRYRSTSPDLGRIGARASA